MNEEDYVIVTWPDSQEIMDCDWFEEECVLINDEPLLSIYGGSAFFVPKERYAEFCNSNN